MKKKKLKSKKKKQGRTKSNLAKRELTPVEQERVESEYARAEHFMLEGNLHQAAEACKNLLRTDPKHAQAINMLSVIAVKDRQLEQAEKFARMAIDVDNLHPDYQNSLGLALLAQERLDEAVEIFQAVLRRNSNYIDALINLGKVEKKRGNSKEEIAFYLEAHTKQPEDMNILKELCITYQSLGKVDEAIEYLKKAIELHPSRMELLQNLAGLYLQANRLDEAQQVVEEIMSRDSGEWSSFIQATLDFRLGNIDNAKRIVDRIQLNHIAPKGRVDAQYLMANIENKLGNYDRAFQLFRKANEQKLDLANDEIMKRRQLNRYFRFNPRSLLSWFSEETVAEWQGSRYEDGCLAPVFLVGFARSGTTLIDQLLFSHPAILTLEEKNTLRIIDKQFSQADGETLLKHLTAHEILAFRRSYWRDVEYFLDIEKVPENKVVIDRDPFKTRNLGHIYRFFPEAKVIVALRDPRDVCLSCFMQNFKLNDMTSHFLDLEETARYYAANMEMLLFFRKHLPLKFHYVHYENFIEDFEREARGLLNFIGLEWEESMLKFHETAKKRYILTVSSDQVVKPLYKGAVGRWRKYEKHLQSILPILKPYVEQFEAERKNPTV